MLQVEEQRYSMEPIDMADTALLADEILGRGRVDCGDFGERNAG